MLNINNICYLITDGKLSFYGDFSAAVSLVLASGESVSLTDSLYRDGNYPVRDLPKKWEHGQRVPYQLWLVKRDEELVLCPTLRSAMMYADTFCQLYGETVSIHSFEG